MSNIVLIRAKKHVRKRFPHLRGHAFRVMLSAIYHAMGGRSVAKSQNDALPHEPPEVKDAMGRLFQKTTAHGIFNQALRPGFKDHAGFITRDGNIHCFPQWTHGHWKDELGKVLGKDEEHGHSIADQYGLHRVTVNPRSGAVTFDATSALTRSQMNTLRHLTSAGDRNSLTYGFYSPGYDNTLGEGVNTSFAAFAAHHDTVYGTQFLQKSLLVRKAARLGSAHPSHKWLRREGSPGNWKYVYDHESDAQGPNNEESQDAEATGGQGEAYSSDEVQAVSGPQGTSPTQEGSTRAGRVMLPSTQMQASEIRDAEPQDLQKPRIVLWLAVSEAAAASIRQQRRYIGSYNNKTVLYGTRMEALHDAPREPEVLIAVRVRTKELEPRTPAENLVEALFNADPEIGGFNAGVILSKPIEGTQIVAIVRPTNPMWPQITPRPDTEGDI